MASQKPRLIQTCAFQPFLPTGPYRPFNVRPEEQSGSRGQLLPPAPTDPDMHNSRILLNAGEPTTAYPLSAIVKD